MTEDAQSMGEPRTFYVVVCERCEPPLPMPFYDFDERDRWAAEHATTGHDEFTWWTEVRTDHGSWYWAGREPEQKEA